MRSTFTLFRNLTLFTFHSPRTLPFQLLPTRFSRLLATANLHEDLPEHECFHFTVDPEPDEKRLPRPEVDVMELSEVPELWRRSRVAWLCKELPSHKAGTLIRILNAQKKWLRQEDATYIIMHCLRIRENDTAFRVSQDVGVEAPIPISVKLGDFNTRIVTAAEHPHLSIPETEAGKTRKQFNKLMGRSLMCVSVGAAVALVGLGAYRIYAARKSSSG